MSPESVVEKEAYVVQGGNGMETQVVVIGGGITGAGILRDLAMRGIDAVLVEKGDLANGTSARFHGLLHSGARYVVNDPTSARECIRENAVQKSVAPHCIEDVGGVFIQVEGDDPSFAEQWQSSCRDLGIGVQEMDPKELIRAEPFLNPSLTRAFRVPDAAVDGFKLVGENVLSARGFGARVLTYTEAISLSHASGQVSGVRIRKPDREEGFISCQMVVNAAGPWTGEIAGLAGLELPILLDKGVLLVFNRRLTGRIINRCRRPGDGDIFVPHHTVSIYGTTSSPVPEAGCDRIDFREAERLLQMGAEMMPAIGETRVIRAFAGVRPLYLPEGTVEDDLGRGVTRDFFVIDHEAADGLAGLISVVGGKFTTYRLMAEKTVDLVAEKLGNSVLCRTHREPLPGAGKEERKRQEADGEDQVICECEQITEKQLTDGILDGCRTLNDLRRRTRLGMGTCQGTFCTYRALEVLEKNLGAGALPVSSLLEDLTDERWKGMRPVFWGATLKEGELMRRIYADLLGLEGGEQGDEKGI